jgi:hypothetical protein
MSGATRAKTASLVRLTSQYLNENEVFNTLSHGIAAAGALLGTVSAGGQLEVTNSFGVYHVKKEGEVTTFHVSLAARSSHSPTAGAGAPHVSDGHGSAPQARVR